MTTFLRDLRFGVRSLWRQKTLSLAAMTTLGVCIAAATTIFSIVNAVVLRPLPFPEPERLALLRSVDAPQANLVLLTVDIKHGHGVAVSHANDTAVQCIGNNGLAGNDE